jgi:hypothetical protein
MTPRWSLLLVLCAVVACRDDHVEPTERAVPREACTIDVDGTLICVRDGGPGGGGDARDGGGGDARDGGGDPRDGGGCDAGDGGCDAGDGGGDANDGGDGDGGTDGGDGDGGTDGGDGDGGTDGGDGDGGTDGGDGDGGTDGGDGDGGTDGGDGDGGTDGGDGDGGTDGGTDGGMDAGVDAGPDAGLGCPANPTCDDVHPTTGARCIGMCDGRCVSKYWRWTFWVTQMNVDRNHSLGLAEHQGIGILGFEYTFDGRFLWNAPGATMPPWRRSADSSEWRKGDLWQHNRFDNSTTQFRMRTTNPSGETQATRPTSLATNQAGLSAYCGMTDLIDRPIYNHGRSLARTFATDSGYERQIPMTWVGYAEECRRPDGTACAGTTAVAAPAQITQCISRRVTDGFCDNQCGNCSYVIPSRGTWTDVIRVATQGRVASFNEGGRTIHYTAARTATPTGPTYTTTNVAEWECLRRSWGFCQAYGWVWHPRPDGFTHCIDPAAELALPATNTAHPFQVLTNGITGVPRALTGKYGHNSNTDAEAAFVTFGDCARAPVATMAAVNVCGSVCGGATPCVSGNNTAVNRWARTAGWHNIDDLSIGLWPGAAVPPTDATWLSPGRPIPSCRDGGFPVYGM